jgi:hypothetical protein
MFRSLAIITGSALVASVALAAPAPAAGYDLATARSELTAAAAATRAEAAHGFSATGTIGAQTSFFDTSVVDAAGNSRTTTHTEPVHGNRTNYASLGVGTWGHLAAVTLKRHAAALAYIGKPNAEHEFAPESPSDPVVMPASGADFVAAIEHNHEGDFTLLSADKVDDGAGLVIYTFGGTLGKLARATTVTVTVTDGLVTRYSTNTPIAGKRTLRYDRSWEYGPQEDVVVPPPSRSLTRTESTSLPSVLVLAATVKRHARQTAATAKSIAKKAHRTKVRVRDVRAAAALVIAHYVESGDYEEDGVPTRATNITGGVALYATDPYKHKVRIAVVQVVKGKVVVST